VMRAAEGPLAHVRGERPDELEYVGPAEPLREVWVALRNNVRGILDNVTLADVIADRIPSGVRELGKKPDLRAY
jgi:DNA-binding IscR family transcriptional regulator